MALFNPQVPSTRDPIWTDVTRPISTTPVDVSTATALKGTTDAFGDLVSGIDTSIKKGLENNIFKDVDSQREQYQAALETVKNAQRASTPTQDLTQGPTTPDNIPVPLQNGMDQVKAIGQAVQIGGTGKVNDTDYTFELQKIAKKYRAQYPGYVSYIDDQVSKASGIPVANAYIKNLLEDINRNSTEGKTELNATRTQLRQMNMEGAPHAADMLNALDAGRTTIPAVNLWIGEQNKLKYTLKNYQDLRAAQKGQSEDAVDTGKTELSDVTAKLVNNKINTMLVTAGSGEGGELPLKDFLQKYAGTGKVSDEEMLAKGQALQALRNNIATDAFTYANQGGANSVINKQFKGDAELAKKTIEGQMYSLDMAIHSIAEDKDLKAAFSHLNFNKAIAADTTNLLYNAPDPVVRNYNRFVGALQQISPTDASKFFSFAISRDVPQKEREWLKLQNLDVMTQTGISTGRVANVKQQVQDAKAQGVTSPKSYGALLAPIDTLNDPKTDPKIKENIANGFFSDATHGLLHEYKPSSEDPKGGQGHVFTKLTSPETTQTMWALGQKKPQLWQNYRTFVEREFGEQLFSTELHDLNVSPFAGWITEQFGGGKQYHLHFDDKNNRFELTDLKDQPMTNLQALYVHAPVQVVNRINTGLYSLSNVYKQEGRGDVGSYLMSTMQRYGFDPNAKGNESMSDIVKMFWSSISNSAPPPKPKPTDSKVKPPVSQ